MYLKSAWTVCVCGIVAAIAFAGQGGAEPLPGTKWSIPNFPNANIVIEFVKALRAGQPPRITAAESLAITEVVLKARQAADEGRIVDL